MSHLRLLLLKMIEYQLIIRNIYQSSKISPKKNILSKLAIVSLQQLLVLDIINGPANNLLGQELLNTKLVKP